MVTKQLRATMAGHHGPVFAVAIAPDGSWLTSAGRDGTVRIWDAATGQQRAKLTANHGAFAGGDRSGRQLARHRRQRRNGADLGRGPTRPTQAALASHRRLVFAIAAAPDGSWLATGGNGGTVRIWDAATGADAGQPARPPRLGRSAGGRAGRQLARHRGQRRNGAHLGRGHLAGTGPLAPPTRPSVRGSRRSGRQLARHRAATGRCGSGTRPPGRNRPPCPANRPGDTRWRSRRTAAGSPPAAATGRCGSGMWLPSSFGPPWPATRPRLRAGGNARRPLARYCGRPRDGADLGYGHLAGTGYPVRPSPRSEHGGGRAGQPLARHR